MGPPWARIRPSRLVGCVFGGEEMTDLQDKFLQLRVAIKRFAEYVGAGGPRYSQTSREISQDLVDAFIDVAREFGHKVLTSLKH
jgi:hypothetical protein